MSDEAELIEAATRAYIDATTNGLCTDRWPRACEDCDCFRDGNAGPGCDAFTRERRIIGHAVAPLLAALAAAREDNDRLRGERRDVALRLGVERDNERAHRRNAESALAAARVEVTQLQARINRARSVLLNGTDEAGGRVFVAHSILAEPLGSTSSRGDCNDPSGDFANWRNCMRPNCCDPRPATDVTTATATTNVGPLGSTEDPPAERAES